MIVFYIANRKDSVYYEQEGITQIDNSINTQENNAKTNIKVHIAGEIQNEGVIEIEYGARIDDIVKNAGGFTENADSSKVNLAYIVEDGQKIYIPNINDEKTQNNILEEVGYGIIENDNYSNKDKVNINNATQTELETLTGIGPSTCLKNNKL